MTDRFVSEAELEEAKKRRQEEWERVRKPGDALEAPDEEVDNQNMIRGLDSDETEFLSKVDDLKAKQDRLIKEEEKAILGEFERVRCRKISENEHSLSKAQLRPEAGNSSAAPKQSKQAAIIRSAIKRKSTSESNDVEKEKRTANEKNGNDVESDNNNNNNGSVNNERITYPSAMKVIGVLPGICQYASSSDSSSDSDSDSDASASESVTVVPVLVRTVSEKSDKSKQSEGSSDD
ncbi:unnamed protein product [Anisakis simplex]|uniref:Protein FAM192A (inferred by orthology to a human protein) n=1 Tax=Anisakis simplex TaxID=6269 RepID=A0A0M3KAS0_ANISI|nr:unnamed protein product [Anisakis simplex]